MTPPLVRVAAVSAPGVVSLMGLDFRLAPVLIGVSAAFLVRVPLMKAHASGLVTELTFTALAMLGAFVTIVDQKIGPGPSFWLGIGFGALGSSLIEIGKSPLAGGLQERLQAATRALLGLKESDN